MTPFSGSLKTRGATLAEGQPVSSVGAAAGFACVAAGLILAFASVKAARVRGAAYGVRRSDTVKPAAA